MKFLIDAHLPTGLVELLQENGHDAIHTIQLPEKNGTSDATINQLSIEQQRIVVTKDTDFYYSQLLQKRPWKLLLIRTGNIRTKELKELFRRNLPAVVKALEENSLVELDSKAMRIIS